MGGRFGRNRNATIDPFYNAVPPVASSPAAYAPSGAYDPYEEYGYEYLPTSSMGNMYGGTAVPQSSRYGGLYAQGLNQMPGVSPWNYGNYYLGNTTMQMMPFMLNKVARYGQLQAMAAMGNAGLLGAAPMMPSMPMTPCCMPPVFSMPMTPCCMPSSYSMPIAAPMMAAAAPLPVAYSPLVQGMYPMASVNPANWMTPSSFMSALASGPMPYRPPAFDFPSNVGMVMTIPYGTRNPMLSSPPYGDYNSSHSFNGGPPWCYSYSMPPAAASAPPAVNYYPRPVSVPQPYPIPYSVPMPVPNVQQVPAPRSVSVVAPPIVAGFNQPLPMSSPNPLWPSQGVFSNGVVGRPAVMASNQNSTRRTVINNETTKGSLPVYNATDQSNSLIGAQITSCFSSLPLNNDERSGVTPSKAKYEKQLHRSRDTLSDRVRRYIPSISRLSRSNYDLNTFPPRSDPVLPPILNGQLISDSGWLPKHSKPHVISSILSKKRRKQPIYTTENGKSTLHSHGTRVSFLPRRRRHQSNSSVSEYDCAICKQQHEKRRLHKYYGSSTISSLLSSNESLPSSTQYKPQSYKHDKSKSSRHHRTKFNHKSKSLSPDKSGSPVLLRRSQIQEQRQNATIHEIVDDDDEEEKEEQIEKKSTDDNDSTAEISDHYTSQLSLGSKDE